MCAHACLLIISMYIKVFTCGLNFHGWSQLQNYFSSEIFPICGNSKQKHTLNAQAHFTVIQMPISLLWRYKHQRLTTREYGTCNTCTQIPLQTCFPVSFLSQSQRRWSCEHSVGAGGQEKLDYMTDTVHTVGANTVRPFFKKRYEIYTMEAQYTPFIWFPDGQST